MDITPALAPRPAGSGQPGRSLHRFANPGRFLRISGAVLPWLAVAGALLTAIGLGAGLFLAPADWPQGDAGRKAPGVAAVGSTAARQDAVPKSMSHHGSSTPKLQPWRAPSCP